MKIRDYPWKSRKLNEFIQDLKAGVSVNSDEDYADGYKYGILKTSCVNNGKFIPTENKPIKIEELEKARVSPQKGRVIISRMNTPDLVGETGFVADDYPELFLPDRMWQTEFSEKICGKWLAEILSTAHFKHEIHSIATGTSNSMKNISKENLLEIKIPFPKYEEQCKQAEVLNTWDCAIELKEKLLEQKKLQKKGLMERLLTGKVRLPGFKDEWRKIKLRDVVERVTRRNDAINTNVLTISAQRGLISQTDYFNRSVASETLGNYFLLKEGEFAYNKSYSNGYPMGAIKRLNGYSEGVVTTLYICFKLRDDTSNSDFFEQYFEAGLLNKTLMKITQEGARAHGLLNIAVSDFFEMSICIPPKLEQEAIADLLVCSDSVIQKNEQEIYQLKAQKKGLMQLLLTGKVRVPC